MRLRAVKAGRIAHAALSAAQRRGPVSIAVNRYQWIGQDAVWVGWGPAMHARAAQLEGPRAPITGCEIDLGGIELWQPRVAARADPESWSALGRELLSGLERPAGYGMLLLGEALPFPLSATVEQVQALIDAYRLDCPERVRDAAVSLLGTGPGLTPSGDDLVAGTLFSRRLLRPFGPDWQAAADFIVHEAQLRTSRISSALFADHVAGDTFEPVYELAPAAPARAREALRRLLSIGHSSGWDFFTGFAIGAGWWPLHWKS